MASKGLWPTSPANAPPDLLEQILVGSALLLPGTISTEAVMTPHGLQTPGAHPAPGREETLQENYYYGMFSLPGDEGRHGLSPH